MKKRLSVFVVLVLLLSYVFSAAAFADLSVSISGAGSATVGTPITLTANVVSSSADIEYMWYSSTINNLAAVNSVGVSSQIYTPPQTVGTVYYCCAVRSASAGGDWVFSPLSAVTYNNGTQGISIVTRPSKWQYYVGETIDLTGLVVQVTNASGTWTSYNGTDLSVSPRVLNAQGEVVVTVSYDGYSASFGVTVAPHTHSYSAWKVTKAATCTATGTRTRTCSCGAVETDTIAKTAHTWNAGTVSNGVKTYTCTVCGATKTETVATTPSPSPKPTATPKPTVSPAGTTGGTGTTGTTGTTGGTTGTTGLPGTSGTTGTTGTNATPVMPTTPGSSGTTGTNNNQQSGGSSFKWWVIPLVAASVGVVAGGGAYMYLTFVKKQ